LSGLGFELSRLETAQWAQNLGDTERESLVPSMLAGMRSVSRSRRTDRAQEYVALCVRVAREVLARSVLEADVRGWLEPYLNVRVLPHRREQILDALQASNPVLAARHLSPSELFLLGCEWVEEMSTRGRPIFSPVLTRLVSVAPSAGADEALSFRRELDQYGVLLRRRMGINQPALAATESYEQLDGAGREELLYERICDLKIQLADLNYRAGIPAVVGEVEGELAIQEILPHRLSTRTATWKYALEQIGRLSPEQALGWVEELMARGTLAAARGGEPDEKGAGSSP
jgi:hypothetical protein